MDINNFSNTELIALSSSLAIFISQDLSANETSIIASFITALGDNLAIIATTKSSEKTGTKKNRHQMYHNKILRINRNKKEPTPNVPNEQVNKKEPTPNVPIKLSY